jgi:rhamnogalacturonyl hydrolase YesR
MVLSGRHLSAAPVEIHNSSIQVKFSNDGVQKGESISIRVGDRWVPALSTPLAATRVTSVQEPHLIHSCTIGDVTQIARGLLIRGDCALGSLEQRITFTTDSDVLAVQVKFLPKPGLKIHSVEDRYNFAPGRRSTDTPSSGPVDFVWSQNIKNEADDLIPNAGFKSPAVMLQQGEVFTALMPGLSARHTQPLALDLDVTSAALPWLSYGSVISQPYGHSYFRRASDGQLKELAGTIQYKYFIVASAQPSKLGYRRVVRLLWSHLGHKQLLQADDAQQNAVRPELATFDEWRKDTWDRYANEVYRGFDCGSRRCGTLVSNRNPWGAWDKPAPDAWFNAWFQTLRSAYGWYLYGRRTGNKDIESKAESVLNLALMSPQNHGAFSTIYLLKDKRWIRDDGSAGFPDDYHAFCMSWTAYWMLKWAVDLTPNRKAEILAFTRPYGDFLVKHQLASGVIPSWYDTDLKPRKEFGNFNAETSSSALFLATLAQVTGDHTYLAAAERAMEFVTKEVLPRERWFDFETFMSCARKPFDFYDHWTAQYPQNNLAAIQAAKAYLALFEITREKRYLEVGTHVLDYLLLTQQVWSPPAFSPKLIGGFTTQNTDAEWSDARQGYASILLFDYFHETGNFEYLERAVAAARSTFAVAPWENWAHTGYIDEPGALTGFHWGAGSAMTSIEMMSPTLGDAFIDVKEHKAVGFNECSIRSLRVDSSRIDFNIESPTPQRIFVVRFAGIEPEKQYRISWNGGPVQAISGRDLITNGYRVGPLR